MKKIAITILFTLFTNFYAPKVNANFTAEKLKVACVVSKLSNPIVTIGGTLLIVPTIYAVFNYVSSKILKLKENDSVLCRFSKKATKLIANIGLTSAGAYAIGYQLNKLNLYPNVMKIFGCGTCLEKAACNVVIWPGFKEVVANKLG